MNEKQLLPAINRKAFDCPHCNVRSAQIWSDVYTREIQNDNSRGTPYIPTQNDLDKITNDPLLDNQKKLLQKLRIKQFLTDKIFIRPGNDAKYVDTIYNLWISRCEHCSGVSVWARDVMIYPDATNIRPHSDLPAKVKSVFIEASKVVQYSPRASAALARLAIQELCNELECKSEKINEQIGELVQRGLNPDIQQMLDAVRVIGNNAVHPGEIDIKDDRDTAIFLLSCINRICQRLITEKKEADRLFDMLPTGAKEQIKKRDSKINDNI